MRKTPVVSLEGVVFDLVTPFIRGDGGLNSRKYKKSKEEHPRIINRIIEMTSFLGNTTFTERLLYLKNGWTEVQLCLNEGCLNKRPMLSLSRGLQKTCSLKCGHNTKEYTDNRKEIAENIDYKEVYEKIRQSNMIKYGVHSTNQLESVKLKKQKTCMDNYGVLYPMQSDEVRNKREDNNMRRIGINNTSRIHMKNLSDLSSEFIKDNFVKNGYFMNEEFMEYFNIVKSTSLHYRKIFGIDTPVKINNLKIQREIYESIPEPKLFNDRKILEGMELDIVNTKYKYAVEFDGLMYHSSGISDVSRFNRNVDKKYHLNKTTEAESKGYQLYHIFEDEWLDEQRREIWKSKLNLNSSKTIGARLCNIEEITSNECSLFLKSTHLQGDIKGSIRIALKYNGDVVSVMLIGKSRMSKKYQYELLRMSSRLDTVIIGGASRMLKYFERKYKPESIVSYANRRWSQGRVYEKIGFTFIHNTPPNYFYFTPREYKLKSRIQFQKHKLKNLLDNFDENISAVSNMLNNGYRIIYDCGNRVYAKIY